MKRVELTAQKRRLAAVVDRRQNVRAVGAALRVAAQPIVLIPPEGVVVHQGLRKLTPKQTSGNERLGRKREVSKLGVVPLDHDGLAVPRL